MNLPGFCRALLIGVALTAICFGSIAKSKVTTSEAEAAVRRYIPLLERSLETWGRNAPCISCHHQALGLSVLAMALEREVPVNRATYSAAMRAIGDRAGAVVDVTVQGIGPASIDPAGDGIFAFATQVTGQPLPIDPVLAWQIAARQEADGGWRSVLHRPPSQESDFAATALAIRRLQLSMPARSASETSVRIARAKRWLLVTPPRTNEDQAFRLLGLAWADAPKVDLEKAAALLLAGQKGDGGWAQLPTRSSDAYATGLTLMALRQGAGLPDKHPGYQRGL